MRSFPSEAKHIMDTEQMVSVAITMEAKKVFNDPPLLVFTPMPGPSHTELVLTYGTNRKTAQETACEASEASKARS